MDGLGDGLPAPLLAEYSCIDPLLFGSQGIDDNDNFVKNKLNALFKKAFVSQIFTEFENPRLVVLW
jgi:hypothetical protein